MVAALVAATIAGLFAVKMDTRPEAFLPAGDPTLLALQRAGAEFGADPLAVVIESTEPGSLLGPDCLPKLLNLEGQLTRLPDVSVVYGPATVLNQIAIASQNLLAQIAGGRDALIARADQEARARGASADAARAEAEQSVADYDRRYGSLLVRGLPAGLPTLKNPHFARSVIFDDSGRPRPQWQFVVPSPQAVAILVRPRDELDQASIERLVDAVREKAAQAGLGDSRITVAGAPTLSAGMAERVRVEAPLLGGLAVLLIGTCYLVVPWRKRRKERIIPLAATLGAMALVVAAFGLAHRPLSVGVVAFLPILVGIGSDFPAYLVDGMNRRRVVVGALASAAGFASLASSPLPFVQELGIALAAGVLLALGLAHLIGRLVQLPQPVDVAQRVVEPIGDGVTRAATGAVRVATSVVAATIAGAGWLGLPHLAIEAQPDHLASRLTEVIDAQHVEGVLGSSGEIDVVLRGPNTVSPEALAWLRDAEARALSANSDQLRPIVSLPALLAFLGPAPTAEQITSALTTLPDYLVHVALHSNYEAAVISLGIKLQELSTQQQLIDAIKRSLPPPPPGYTAEVSGLPVAAARGYELVSQERYLSSALGILLAGLVLLIGLRERGDALRAITAAVLATGWGLAIAWLIGLPLTPLTVALGSLTTVTACEFTIMMRWGRRSGRRAASRTVAIAAAAATVGYLALTASKLSVIRDFGLVLAATVALSYLAGHLLAGPLHPLRGHGGSLEPRMRSGVRERSS